MTPITPAIKISLATTKDIPALSRFYQSIIRESPYYSEVAIKEELKRFSIKNLTKEFCDKDNLYLIAKLGNEIVGARNGYREAGMFWSDWGVVHASNRCHGISRPLMAFFENKLKKEGAHKIWCDSRTNNKESILSLKSFGFKK